MSRKGRQRGPGCGNRSHRWQDKDESNESKKDEQKSNGSQSSGLVGYICPICNANKYTEISRSNGIMGPGSKSWTIGYICKGCFVQFKSVEKFSKKRQI